VRVRIGVCACQALSGNTAPASVSALHCTSVQLSSFRSVPFGASISTRLLDFSSSASAAAAATATATAC